MTPIAFISQSGTILDATDIDPLLISPQALRGQSFLQFIDPQVWHSWLAKLRQNSPFEDYCYLGGLWVNARICRKEDGIICVEVLQWARVPDLAPILPAWQRPDFVKLHSRMNGLFIEIPNNTEGLAWAAEFARSKPGFSGFETIFDLCDAQFVKVVKRCKDGWLEPSATYTRPNRSKDNMISTLDKINVDDKVAAWLRGAEFLLQQLQLECTVTVRIDRYPFPVVRVLPYRGIGDRLNVRPEILELNPGGVDLMTQEVRSPVLGLLENCLRHGSAERGYVHEWEDPSFPLIEAPKHWKFDVHARHYSDVGLIVQHTHDALDEPILAGQQKSYWLNREKFKSLSRM